MYQQYRIDKITYFMYLIDFVITDGILTNLWYYSQSKYFDKRVMYRKFVIILLIMFYEHYFAPQTLVKYITKGIIYVFFMQYNLVV